MATITDDTQFIPAGSKANQQETHREHVFPVQPGRQFTFFRINDEQYGCNNIPFGWVNTHLKGSQPKEENVTTPVIPLRYTEASFDPQQAEPLREGWLYTFRNGKLWREQEITSSSYFKDVHLVENKGKNHRKATSIPDSRVMLPHKINCKIQVIEMAYSEVQWSWNYIKKLEEKADLRTKRMQEIPLDNYNSGFAPNTPTGNQALVENIKNAPPLPRLFLDKQSEIPVVYLHDTLGIAKSHVAINTIMREDFQSYIVGIESLNHLSVTEIAALKNDSPDERLSLVKAAQTTYRTFFDEDLRATRPKTYTVQLPDNGGYKTIEGKEFVNQDSTTKMLRTSAGALDKDYLEKILAVDERKEKRTAMRKGKQDYVNFLNNDLEGPPAGLPSDYVSIKSCLTDYASLEGLGYILFFRQAITLFSFLNIDPCLFDSSFDLPATTKTERLSPDEDPGILYMTDLMEGKNPIHAMLFPAESQVDIFSEEDVKYSEPQTPDGSGNFRINAFGAIATVSKAQVMRTQDTVLKGLLAEAKQIFSDAGDMFNTQWRNAMAEKKSLKGVECILRLVKGQNLPEIEGMKVVLEGGSLEGRVIIDAQGRISQELDDRGAIRDQIRAGKNKGHALNLVDSRTGVVHGSQDIVMLGKGYKGVIPPMTPKSWMGRVAGIEKLDDGYRYVTAKFDVITTVDDGYYARHYRNPGFGGKFKDAAIPKIVSGLNRVLPPAVAILETMNLWGAVVHPDPQASGRKKVATYLASLWAFGYAALDAPTKMFQRDDVVRWLGQHGSAGGTGKKLMYGKMKIGPYSIRILRAMNGSAAGLGMVVSSWDMVDSIKHDDHDAAVGHGIAATGAGLYALHAFSVSSLSFIGLAASPWGWAFMGVTLIGVVIAMACTDSEFEAWAKHSPFAKDIDERMTDQFIGESYNYAHGSLIARLMMPQLTIKEDRAYGYSDDKNEQWVHDMAVELRAPGFVPGKSVLSIYVTREIFDMKSSRMAYVGTPEWSGPQEVVLPHDEAEIIFEEGTDQQIGLRLRFKGVPAYVKWRVRARHITPEQVVLPPVPKDAPKDYPPEISKKTKGWLYASREQGQRYVPHHVLEPD